MSYEIHNHSAVELKNWSGPAPKTIAPSVVSYRFATGDDETRLLKWLTRMHAMTENVITPDHFQSRPSNSAHQNITELSQTLFNSDAGHTCLITNLAAEASTLLKLLFFHYHFFGLLIVSLFIWWVSLHKHGLFFIRSGILFTSVFEDEALR